MPSAVLQRPPQTSTTRPGAPRRTRVLAQAEARWAAAATLAFLLALLLQLTGAPAWVWGPLYAVAYVTGVGSRAGPDCGRCGRRPWMWIC